MALFDCMYEDKTSLTPTFTPSFDYVKACVYRWATKYAVYNHYGDIDKEYVRRYGTKDWAKMLRDMKCSDIVKTLSLNVTKDDTDTIKRISLSKTLENDWKYKDFVMEYMEKDVDHKDYKNRNVQMIAVPSAYLALYPEVDGNPGKIDERALKNIVYPAFRMLWKAIYDGIDEKEASEYIPIPKLVVATEFLSYAALMDFDYTVRDSWAEAIRRRLSDNEDNKPKVCIGEYNENDESVRGKLTKVNAYQAMLKDRQDINYNFENIPLFMKYVKKCDTMVAKYLGLIDKDCKDTRVENAGTLIFNSIKRKGPLLRSSVSTSPEPYRMPFMTYVETKSAPEDLGSMFIDSMEIFNNVRYSIYADFLAGKELRDENLQVSKGTIGLWFTPDEIEIKELALSIFYTYTITSLSIAYKKTAFDTAISEIENSYNRDEQETFYNIEKDAETNIRTALKESMAVKENVEERKPETVKHPGKPFGNDIFLDMRIKKLEQKVQEYKEKASAMSIERDKAESKASEYKSAMEDILNDTSSDEENLKKIESLVEQNAGLKDELSREKKRAFLLSEQLSKKWSNLTESDNEALVFYGDEKDLYPGEQKTCVLSILEDSFAKANEGTRKYDILKSVLSENPVPDEADKLFTDIKNLFYTGFELNARGKQDLKALGFIPAHANDSSHYYVQFMDDPRYGFTMAKTTSDNKRAWKNMYSDITRVLDIRSST